MRRRELLGLLLMFLFVMDFYIVFVYPGVSDFDFWHMGISESIEQSGSMRLGDKNAGFYVLTIIVVNVCEISYTHLPFLPLQLIPLFVGLAALFTGSTRTAATALLCVGAYLTFSANPSQFNWGYHDLGLVLILTLMVASKLHRSDHSRKSRLQSTALLMVLIVALNFMSYKMTLVAVIYLASMELLRRIENRRLTADTRYRKWSFSTISAFGIVFILSFNEFFYNEFIPVARLSAEDAYSHSSGLQKLFFGFSAKSEDPLSSYYIQSSSSLLLEHTLWLVILATGLIWGLYLVLGRMKQKRRISVREEDFIGLLGCAALIMVVYTFLGLSELLLVILVGLLGYLLLSNVSRNRLVRLSIVAVTAMVALNAISAYQASEQGIQSGQRSHSYFDYVNPAAEWCILSNDPDIVTYTTDVFTLGFIDKAAVEKGFGSDMHLVLFDRGQLQSLLNPDYNLTTRNVGSEDIYIINYGLDHFETNGWENYESWSNSHESIDESRLFDVVFSSGDVEILAQGLA